MRKYNKETKEESIEELKTYINEFLGYTIFSCKKSDSIFKKKVYDKIERNKENFKTEEYENDESIEDKRLKLYYRSKGYYDFYGRKKNDGSKSIISAVDLNSKKDKGLEIFTEDLKQKEDYFSVLFNSNFNEGDLKNFEEFILRNREIRGLGRRVFSVLKEKYFYVIHILKNIGRIDEDKHVYNGRVMFDINMGLKIMSIFENVEYLNFNYFEIVNIVDGLYLKNENFRKKSKSLIIGMVKSMYMVQDIVYLIENNIIKFINSREGGFGLVEMLEIYKEILKQDKFHVNRYNLQNITYNKEDKKYSDLINCSKLKNCLNDYKENINENSRWGKKHEVKPKQKNTPNIYSQPTNAANLNKEDKDEEIQIRSVLSIYDIFNIIFIAMDDNTFDEYSKLITMLVLQDLEVFITFLYFFKEKIKGVKVGMKINIVKMAFHIFKIVTEDKIYKLNFKENVKTFPKENLNEKREEETNREDSNFKCTEDSEAREIYKLRLIYEKRILPLIVSYIKYLIELEHQLVMEEIYIFFESSEIDRIIQKKYFVHSLFHSIYKITRSYWMSTYRNVALLLVLFEMSDEAFREALIVFNKEKYENIIN